VPDEPLEEQGGGEPERPDFLLERFNTVDDQAKSYAELERSFTQGQQRLRGLEEAYQDLVGQFEELQQLQQQPASAPEQTDYTGQSPLLAMIQQARDNDDLQTELQLQAAMQRGLWEAWSREQQAQMEATAQPDQNEATVNQLFAIQTEQLARQVIPDWDEIKAGVHDTIMENEYLLQDTNEPMEAVRMLQNASAIYRQQQQLAAPAQGGTQQQAGRQQKMLSQTMQGQGTHPGTEQTDDQWQDYVRSQKIDQFKL
jgi:hypothetical protein